MNWLGFSNLAGAWFLAASVPLVILYFLKLKRPRLEVASLTLWQSVVNDQRVNSPFQKFRRNLLLLLQLLLLGLLVCALMQPFLQAGADTAEYLPILIDCSASMAAVEETAGKSRLDLVREQVQEMIDGLHGDQRIALFSFTSTGRRLTEFTDDRRALTRALNSLQPSQLPGQLDDVLRMAAAYTRTFEIEKVLVMTDGNLPDQVDFELPFSLDLKRVAPAGPNTGITELSARRSSTDEWEVFVRVSGSTSDLRGGELQLFENGEKTATETVETALDESQRMVFPVSASVARLLEARLVPVGSDSLTVDNSAWLALPAARPLRTRVSASLSSWHHALRVQPRLELDQGDQSSVQSEYDLLISDTAEVAEVQAPVQVFVGVVPEDLTALVSVEEEITNVVDWNRTAPVLRHVQLADVQIGEKPTYAAGITAKELEERGYEVLIDGRAGPLLLQRREGLKVSFWFLFHTDRSTLPYRLGFPILAANLVESALKQAALSEVAAAATGVLPPLSLEADREYTVRDPEGDEVRLRSAGSGLLSGAPASTVGMYTVLDGGDAVASVGTGLLSPLESSLQASENIRFTELNISTTDTSQLDSDRPLWWLLTAGAFLLMLGEWWYFQRERGALS